VSPGTTDCYKAKSFSLDTPDDNIEVRGEDRYVPTSLGHRLAFVRIEDVDVLGSGSTGMLDAWLSP
jgi:hypothetical protein